MYKLLQWSCHHEEPKYAIVNAKTITLMVVVGKPKGEGFGEGERGGGSENWWEGQGGSYRSEKKGRGWGAEQLWIQDRHSSKGKGAHKGAEVFAVSTYMHDS